MGNSEDIILITVLNDGKTATRLNVTAPYKCQSRYSFFFLLLLLLYNRTYIINIIHNTTHIRVSSILHWYFNTIQKSYSIINILLCFNQPPTTHIPTYTVCNNPQVYDVPITFFYFRKCITASTGFASLYNIFSYFCMAFII